MKGWKTLLWSLLLAFVGVLQAFDWTTVIPSGPNSGYLLMIVGAVTAALRYVTTTPVGSNGQSG